MPKTDGDRGKWQKRRASCLACMQMPPLPPVWRGNALKWSGRPISLHHLHLKLPVQRSIGTWRCVAELLSCGLAINHCLPLSLSLSVCVCACAHIRSWLSAEPHPHSSLWKVHIKVVKQLFTYSTPSPDQENTHQSQENTVFRFPSPNFYATIGRLCRNLGTTGLGGDGVVWD